MSNSWSLNKLLYFNSATVLHYSHYAWVTCGESWTLWKLSTHSLRNLLQPCQSNANKMGHVAFKLFKNGNPYTIVEFGNKEVPQFNPLIGHRYKNCSNEMKYSCLHSGSYCGVPSSKFTLDHFIPDASKCPRFRCRDNWNEVWTWNTWRLQNFCTNASCSRKSAIACFHQPVLSLARPYFLTGAIIDTRSQASLLTPPGDMLLIWSRSVWKEIFFWQIRIFKENIEYVVLKGPLYSW